MKIDINADIGEGFVNDKNLFSLISSCNIACGGHVGDYKSIKESIKLAINHNVKIGNKVYTSGKEGIFDPGIPIGTIMKQDEKIIVSLFSDINQIMFVNINLGKKEN